MTNVWKMGGKEGGRKTAYERDDCTQSAKIIATLYIIETRPRFLIIHRDVRDRFPHIDSAGMKPKLCNYSIGAQCSVVPAFKRDTVQHSSVWLIPFIPRERHSWFAVQCSVWKQNSMFQHRGVVVSTPVSPSGISDWEFPPFSSVPAWKYW
jgi:hypothetical protein